MAEPSVPPSPPPPSSDNVPSSFDSSPEFFEEKRFAKLTRRIKEEPLIPLGCAATCYALYQASRSIRAGDHHRTNRMFRARIYAQGFTLLALVGGSIFWQDERMKRKQLEKAMEQKKAAEKREKWLKELEDRDREDREWRQRFEGVAARAREVEKGASGVVKEKIGQGAGKMEEGVEMVKEETKEGAKKGKESMKQAIEKAFQNKSVLEQVDRSGWGRGMWMVREAWRRS